MTLRSRLGVAAFALLAIVAVGWFASDSFRGFVYFAWRGVYFAVRRTPPRCKERAVELNAKIDLLQRDAKNSLKHGAKKDDVVRFFASKNIPLTFDQIGRDQEATGAVSIKGLPECENVACGDDSALIGVRVEVDPDRTVVSDPVVRGIYANCL